MHPKKGKGISHKPELTAEAAAPFTLNRSAYAACQIARSARPVHNREVMDAQGNLIVVLEDDPRVRGALCMLLSDWDFRTAEGASASEALAKIGAAVEAVIAVITDYDLGAGVNGVDEAHALRAAGIAAPVLVISGSLRGKAGELAKEAGFHFLSKPVKPLDIQNWLATRTG